MLKPELMISSKTTSNGARGSSFSPDFPASKSCTIGAFKSSLGVVKLKENESPPDPSLFPSNL